MKRDPGSRRLTVPILLAGAFAASAVLAGVEPAQAVGQEPMPRMRHEQRQAAAAARQEQIQRDLKAHQEANPPTGDLQQQNPGRPNNTPQGTRPARPRTRN